MSFIFLFSFCMKILGLELFFFGYLCAGIQRFISLSACESIDQILKTKDINLQNLRTYLFLCPDVGISIPTPTQERVDLPRSVTQYQGAGSCNLKNEPPW